MGNCLRNGPRSDSVLMSDEASSHVAIGQNQLLSTSPEKWTAEVPMTEGQLRGKRDTFWETAPAYDGRREIWDALKAVCEAVEEGEHALAQAILDGANISLPTGRLVEVYDELGNRYVLPKFCISRPTNMEGASPQLRRARAGTEESNETDSATTLLLERPASPPGGVTGGASVAGGGGTRNRAGSAGGKNKRSRSKSKSKVNRSGGGKSPTSPAVDRTPPVGDPVVVKVRLSTMSRDLKMTLQASDRVRDMKHRLEAEQGVTGSRITMLYSGRVLNDRTYIKNLDIPKGFLIQAIVT